ncbi:SBA1 [Candida oxycetoniae]|uniref:SBA1 n=1 Tax=Candida oxycetoniae TaxID=497107 RepID=A0AAI9SU27_9ASCO|nr:SBA1 [Candida oxycetoniae]KAI3403076.1 SBA1 [Candida oxycetoniae]
MSTDSVTPTVLWAQRSNGSDASKNVVLLTVQITDYTDLKIDLQPTYLSLKAKSSAATSVSYELKIDFYEEIDPKESKINTESGNHIYMVLRKKKLQEEYWPRLTKEKLKYHYIKTDFDKWVDEDEQDEVKDDADLMGGMGGMPGMPGMGGMGGMPGMDGMGMGGAGGMDFSQLLSGMGGAGGGAGGTPDLNALASQLGAAGGNAGDLDFSSLGGDSKDGGDDDDNEEIEEIGNTSKKDDKEEVIEEIK